ncbi:hypothetical protein M5K25_000295 [Dendrobium thyrsiflorum]|uniref:Kri1-like C-terminal domain-containing protein n=1 Tax=Dendrobium thyrsiflorum TaxID=117978 RepID=A0ABD0VTK2_DENTH
MAQRKSKEERMVQAEFQRKEELNHLKNLKKKEIQEKLKRIRATAGIDYYNTEDVDPGFRSDEWDDLTKPDFQKEDKLLGKRKRKQKISLREKVELEKELDEYYKLDYEGNIGDLKTRFTYRFVPAYSYGLQTEEILIANDKDLNQYVSLKKLAPYTENKWKVTYHQKLKKNIILQGVKLDACSSTSGGFLRLPGDAREERRVDLGLFLMALNLTEAVDQRWGPETWLVKKGWKKWNKFVSPVMPFIVVATVAILCDSAIAQRASAILLFGLQVIIAAIPLHGSGFFFSYVLSKLLGIGYISAQTISIEVGMQNSVLGVVLTSQHFANPLTAVPCAVSSICQSIYGSVLAGILRSMPVETKVED